MAVNPSPSIGAIPDRRSADADAVLTVAAAVPADAPQLVEVIAGAFLHDPTWAWALPDPAGRRRFWELSLTGALRFPWVLRTAGCEAVAVWIPPGEAELAPEAEAGLPALMAELAGDRAGAVLELLHRFDAAHPHTEPHYYLSLLATAAAHRGYGLGLALLAENLARIDAEHQPAYLESSNPVNDRRYQALGFVPVVSFQAPDDGPRLTGMWRARR